MVQRDLEKTELTEHSVSETNTPGQSETLTPGNQILNISYLNLVIGRAVYMITKLGIPDLLQKAPLKSEVLAQATGSHPRALYRLLRAAGSAGILSESPDHAFSLTPLGDVLRSDAPGSMRGLVIYCGESFYLKCWDELAYSIRSGKPSWDKVLGLDHFEYFRQNPEIGTIFDQLMTAWSNNEAAALTKAFDFSGCHTIVDVGGGHGILLTHILKANPNAHGVLFDQDQVIEGARNKLKTEGLLHRCELVAGDFFTSVPPGGDAYIMKSILHDWPDEPSITILKSCRRAMDDNGRLLVVETVVPPPGEPHFSKYQDLEMLLVLEGAQERTLEEFEALFAQAELKMSRAVPTEESHSIIEAVPV